MSFKIQDLRNELFDTLKKVKSGEVDIAQARSVCDIASVIVESARAETEFVRMADAISGSDFIPIAEKPVYHDGKKLINGNGSLNGKHSS